MMISPKPQNTGQKQTKIFSTSRLFLLLTLLLCLCVLPAHAQSGLKEAQALNSIGLFSGTDQGFELERTPTRAEALVMLLKLTGQAQAALDSNLPHPFTDGSWASAFIGYGYTNGYTSGVSDTEFGTAQPATAQQYSVFLLRALGYTINEDYTYEKALPFFLSHAPALTPEGNTFTRGDMAAMSLAALAAPMKDGSGTLAEKLSAQNLFSMDDYKKARDGAISDEKADVTVLMYIVGSDLESDDGMATADVQEMLDANLNDSINLVLQTGGTKDWKNDWMTDGATQRFEITDEEIVHLSTLENALMSQPDTLSNFLRWGVTSYPAQRYILVFWDHGEGTMNGFGIDELNDGKTLSLGEMSRAFDWSDTHFELVAFDACLMATLTTGHMLRDHADYLLASEELEPPDGWYYSEWLTALSEKPNMSIDTLNTIICSSYLTSTANLLWHDSITISLLDLNRLEPVVQEWKALLKQLPAANRYVAKFKDILSGTKRFGGIGSYDQYDLIDFLSQPSLQKMTNTQPLIQAVRQAVLYTNLSSCANGLAVYIPHKAPDHYWNETRDSLIECGFEEEDLYFFDCLVKKQ